MQVECWTIWNIWKTSPSSVLWSRSPSHSRHSWRTSFWMKTLQPSEPQSSVALLLGGGCLVTGFRVPLGSAAKELTSPPGGPFLGLTVDSPVHSPRDPDHTSLIYAAPGLTQLHHTGLHTAPGWAVCAAVRWQTWAQAQLQFLTSSPSWMSPCLSKPVYVLPAHRGWCPHGLLGMSSDIGGTRPGIYGSRDSGNQCLQPLYIILINFHISFHLLLPIHSPYEMSLWVCMGECIPVLTLVGQKKAAPVRRNR